MKNLSLSQATIAIFIILAFGLFGIWMNSYTFATLWHWFIVPFGVKEISLPHAYGLITLAGFIKAGLFFKVEITDDKIDKLVKNQLGDEDGVSQIKSMIKHVITLAVVLPLISLAVGKIVTLCM